jgi:hypothetical protein
MRCVRVAIESAESDARRLEDERQRLLVLDMFRQVRIALASYAKRARIGSTAALVAVLAFASTATAGEPPAPQKAANALQCVCPTNGAREGEDIAARVQRLEVEYRLARAELLVANLKRRRK